MKEQNNSQVVSIETYTELDDTQFDGVTFPNLEKVCFRSCTFNNCQFGAFDNVLFTECTFNNCTFN
jgi:hypothetical protein